MRIIAQNPISNTKEDAVVLIFEDDNELNDFITDLATTEVKTSGARIKFLIPKGMKLSPIQIMVAELIESLDGINGKNHTELINKAEIKFDALIDKLKDID